MSDTNTPKYYKPTIPIDVDWSKVKPGERLNGETAKAWAAFQVYRDLGPQRSQAKVCETLGKRDNVIGKWSTKFHWQKRVEQWDNYLDEQRRKEQVQEAARMTIRHARLSSNMIRTLMAPALELQRRIQAAHERGETIDFGSDKELVDTVGKLVNPIKNLCDIERISRGQHTESHEIREQDTETKQMAQRILNDPEASELADELLERIAPGSSYPGVVGTSSE